jgi:hypothetical protein
MENTYEGDVKTWPKKKKARPVETSPRILSQIELLKKAKSGDLLANREILSRLNDRNAKEEQSRD